jgi:hypothetical protein
MKVLKRILKKIADKSKSDFIQHFEMYGAEKAEKFVILAIDFGGEYASTWLNDSSYARLITLNDMYNAPGWR